LIMSPTINPKIFGAMIRVCVMSIIFNNLDCKKGCRARLVQLATAGKDEAIPAQNPDIPTAKAIPVTPKEAKYEFAIGAASVMSKIDMIVPINAAVSVIAMPITHILKMFCEDAGWVCIAIKACFPISPWPMLVPIDARIAGTIEINM
jgi:hypothetical protein